MKCINEGCFNGAIYGGECPACVLVRAATEDTRRSGYSGSSLFAAVDAVEKIEWPDDLQDWVL